MTLPNFEGPLDLLLYLIKKDEIDIVDIPIAEITRQYLGYVDLMKELDLEVAGEFILMAATLIQIKVRMLLPRPEGDTEEEAEDPRAELVRQLLEYRRFKEVAEILDEKEFRQRRLFPRSDFGWAKKYLAEEEKEEFDPRFMGDVSLFDLLTAFKIVLDNIPKITAHEVTAVGPTIEEQIEYVLKVMGTTDRIAFRELRIELRDRVTIIVTFMAMLELIRTHRIRIQQAATYGELWIVKP